MAGVLGTIHVIHCRRLEARRRVLESRLAVLDRPTRWMVDLDPDTIPPDAWRRVARRARLTRAEVSVYLKHERVFRSIAESGDDVAFVLEDDALLPDDFGAVLDRHLQMFPADAGMAYLGASCGLEMTPQQPGGLFGREHGTRSMSAVVVRPVAARVVADALRIRPIEQPIDLTVNAIIREHDIPVVWSVPALVPNGSETGRFPHSLGVSWRGGGWLGRLRRAFS
jgi:glycosyl transferase family 25